MRVNYVFGDLKTGEIIQEIPMFGVTITDLLNRYGELGGSYQLDMTGKRNDELVAASIPGRCYVVVELDEKAVWGGIVWTRTYQATSKTLQLYCKSFEAYPNERFIRTSINYNNVDQATIFLNLWQQMQSVTHGSLSVELPSNIPTGITKSLVVEPEDYKTYGQVISSLADGANGFDWQIDVVRAGNAYRRILRMGYPTLGVPVTDSIYVLEYPGAVINYWATERISSAGTHVDVLGAGDGKKMITGRYIHNDLLASGWVEFDVDVPYKDVTSQSILDDLTLTEGLNRRPPATVIKAEVKIDLDPVFGSYNLGDFMKIVIDDPRYDKFGLTKRLIGWDLRPPGDEEVGRAILTFEGDEE